MLKTGNDWDNILKDEFEKEYFVQLQKTLHNEYQTQTVYPAKENIFNALKLTVFSDVKAVLLGQDPYHGKGQAHGLAFSVPPGHRFQPSLRNIFQEIQDDIGTPVPASGDLTRWAEQGVLLLNSVLTVRTSVAASHAGKGWEQFTDAAIRELSKQRDGIVYILWGQYAQKKAEFVDGNKNLILKSAHPSVYSCHNFFGNKHFSKTNEYLTARGQSPIEW